MRYVFLLLLILAVAMLLGQIERESLALTPLVHVGHSDGPPRPDASG